MTWRAKHYAMAAGGFAAGALGFGWLVRRMLPQGPPTREQLDAGLAITPPEAPEPVPGETLPPLPPVGEKVKAYPGPPSSKTDPSAWVQVKEQPGMQVRSAKRAWASPSTAAAMADLAARWVDARKALELGPFDLRVWDVSKQGGGPLGSHASHRNGYDVDLVLAGPPETGNLAPVALPELLRVVLEDPNVQSVFLDWNLQKLVWDAADVNEQYLELRKELQYPLPRHTGRTRVRHWAGHRDHIHIRFRQ